MKELARMRLLTGITPDMAQSWYAQLADLSENELKRGLLNARSFTGFFTLPAFRELCRVTPEGLGMPDAQRAYREACMAEPGHAWSHPAVYHAALATGHFELRNLTEQQCFPRFRNAYEEMTKRVLAGERLDLPVREAIPSKIPHYLTPSENKSRMAKLMAEINL